MKKILNLLFFAIGLNLLAQEVDSKGNLQISSQKFPKVKFENNRLQGWYISGRNALQFNQTAFSNWMAGGVNSYALNANVEYEFNLTKNRHIWDTRIALVYGIMRNEGEDYRKTNDVIDLSSSYGYEMVNKFYLTGAVSFKSQFSEGFDHNVEPKKYISNFMAPGYFQFGLGVDYRPSDNFQAYFHPFTSKFTFVLDPELQTAGNYGLKEDGDSFVYEFGAFFGARYKLTLMENITFDNRLGVYSNYLENPQNMTVAYQGVLDLKVNKLISAQATINLFYDENQIKRTQAKQTLGVGLAYKFDNSAKLKEKNEKLPQLEIQPEAEVVVEDTIIDTAEDVVESTEEVIVVEEEKEEK